MLKDLVNSGEELGAFRFRCEEYIPWIPALEAGTDFGIVADLLVDAIWHLHWAAALSHQSGEHFGDGDAHVKTRFKRVSVFPSRR